MAEVSARTRHARELFAPLGPTYDRYARLLSFGQDPRWRAFLVSRDPGGRAARARRRVRHRGGRDRARARACRRARSSASTRARRCSPPGARASRAPGSASGSSCARGARRRCRSPTREFDALTFTYLLRYVDDPAATLRELARVVRPGGDGRDARVRRAARRLAAALGAVRPGRACPRAGALVSPGWHEVGSFLGPSIRGFCERYPVGRAARALARGRARRRARRGGSASAAGIVIWGTRA